MMSSMQVIYQLLILTVVITLSVSRPQNGLENQETTDNQPSISDMQKYYSSYRVPGAGGYLGVEEPNPLERLQMQIIKGGSPYQSGFSNGANMAYLDPIFRIPEMKRQVRYRQCYFNPISCFKK